MTYVLTATLVDEHGIERQVRWTLDEEPTQAEALHIMATVEPDAEEVEA